MMEDLFDLIAAEIEQRRQNLIAAKISLKKAEKSRLDLLQSYIAFLSSYIDINALMSKRRDSKIVSQRKAISKYLIDKGYNHGEIAELLGITRSTISSYFTKLKLSDEDFEWIEKIKSISKRFDNGSI